MLLLSLLIDWHAASTGSTCAPAIAAYHRRLDEIENLRGRRTFANTVLPLERATSAFRDDAAPSRFLGRCPEEKDAEQGALARPKLYAALTKVPLPPNPTDAALDKRWIVLLQRGGAALTPARRKEFLSLQLSQASAFNPDLDQRIAHLLGYETWNDYLDADRSAGNAMRVEKFMQTANAAIAPAADAQERHLKDAFAASQGRRKRAMQPPDIPNAERLLEKLHGVDEALVRQWFPADTTRLKIFALIGSLFGVSIASTNEPTWQEAVQSFAVSDSASKKRLGTIYVSVYPQGGAFAASTVVPGRAVAIRGRDDTTLTHGDIVAFFGATCESMREILAATPYETLNESVPLDFATAPAQMCESFAWDPSALRQIASDNKAGQPLPDDLVDNIVAARTLYNAFQLRQVTNGAYEPLWARLYADDLFTAFSSGVSLDPAIGVRFRSTILAPAGSLDPDTEMQNFLGRPVSPQAFYKEFTP